MRRALAYVALLGALTGAVAGVALFGLPLPAGEGSDAGAALPLAGALLERGWSLADLVAAGGALAAAVLLLAGLLELRRAGRA